MSATGEFGPPRGLPVTFTLDGEPYTLAVIDTRSVLESLAHGNWLAIIPGALAEADAEALWTRLIDPDDPADLEDLEDIALAEIGAVLGVDLHAAMRLANVAWREWMVFDGWCFERGLNPFDEPIWRVIAGIYTWLRSGIGEDKELAKLDAKVWSAVPAVEPIARDPHARRAAPGWSAEREAAAWQTTYAQLGGLASG